MPRRLHLVFGCVLFACLGAWVTEARSQTRVRVMAETRVDVAAERAGDRVQVFGVLRDDLGQALPGRELQVMTRQLVEGETAAALAPPGVFGVFTVATDDRGEFALSVEWTSGRFSLGCAYAGDDFHLPANVERVVDPTLADVRLRFDLDVTGRQLDLDMPDARVRVVAESSQGGEGLAVTLRDELGREHGSATTDAQGHALFVLDPAADAAPGPGRWLVEFAGDERRAAARAELPIVRIRATTLTATLDVESVDPGETATLSGTLRDSRGGVVGAVGIFAEGEHVSTVVTDEQGAYSASFEAPRDREGSSWTLEARFTPESPGHQASVSSPVTLQVSSPWPLDWLWLLLPVALSVVALVLARRRERREASPATRAVAHAPGITVGARTHVTHRHDQLAGVVLDHRSGAPRAGAIIMLSRAGRSPGEDTSEQRTLTDERGRFSLMGLPAGEYRLRVQLAGYVAVDQSVHVPHRGEWSDVVVRVESYRARALAVFRRVGRRFVTSERVFETTTNREIPGSAPDPHRGPLMSLAEETDRLYYGPTNPEPEDLPPLERAAAALEEQIQPAVISRDPSD